MMCLTRNSWISRLTLNSEIAKHKDEIEARTKLLRSCISDLYTQLVSECKQHPEYSRDACYKITYQVTTLTDNDNLKVTGNLIETNEKFERQFTVVGFIE